MDTAPLDTAQNFTPLFSQQTPTMSGMEKLPSLPKLKTEEELAPGSVDDVHLGDDVDDAGSLSEQKLPRQIAEGFVAYNKSFMHVEVTDGPTNPVKKDTTTSSGKVNHSPCTPLKAIAGTSIQLLKIDGETTAISSFCCGSGQFIVFLIVISPHAQPLFLHVLL